MPNPHVSANFGDLLDPRFQKIFFETWDELPDMIPEFYDVVSTNGRNDMRWSEVGTLPDWTQFDGSVDYVSSSQGYDTVATPLEFASGIQIERPLFDDDQYGIMDQRPSALADAAARTRQKHAARVFNNAFSVDTMFYVNSEGVPMCSNSHTTTSGASTSTGFDNYGTAALSATAVAAARIAMRGFRGDQANRISIVPDLIIHPVDLYEEAYEISKSMGKLDTAYNNVNVHYGKYKTIEWEYITDTNNWWLADSTMMKRALKWVNRVPIEFAMTEDFDTFVAKWRGYHRYAMAVLGWRWVFGHEVS